METTLVNAEFLMLVVVILVQGGTGIWWASNLTSRIRSLETGHNGIDRDQRSTDASVQKMEVSMALLTQSFEQVSKGLEKIEARLGQIERHMSEDARS